MRHAIPSLILTTALLSAAEADQTFELTFDSFTTTADHAVGRAASTTFTEDLSHRKVTGANGRNAFSIREGESLKYAVAGNIDHRQGTLSVWLKAENYDPSRVSSTDPEKSHKSFINILFRDGRRWTRFYLYEYYEAPIFYFYCNNSAAESNARKTGGAVGYKVAGASAATIRQQQWFQVAVTWDANFIQIFLDGESKEQKRLPPEASDLDEMRPDETQSFIGIRDRLWPEGAIDVGKDTIVDDVRIWSRPLKAEEIQRQYLLSASGRATVPRTSP